MKNQSDFYMKNRKFPKKPLVVPVKKSKAWSLKKQEMHCQSLRYYKNLDLLRK